MGITLTKERFFTELLDPTFPGLSGIGETYRKSEAEATRRFAEALRNHLNPAPYLSAQDLDYYENAWRHPGESDEDTARRIMAHRLISVQFEHDFKGPVDWLKNPTYNGYREWTWQLNRHHEWRHLAKMYYLTGNDEYAASMAEIAASFFAGTTIPSEGEVNGYGTDAFRTIEIGIRLANNWPFAILATLHSPAISDDFLVDFFMALYQNARRLRTAYTSHNWLIMEMNGLIHAATLFPIFRESRYWETFAFRTLEEEFAAQFYPDHFQYELSTGYHGTVIDNYLNVFRLFRAIGRELPASFRRGVHDAYLIYPALCRPNGRTPSLNDGVEMPVSEKMKQALEYFPGDPIFSRYADEEKRREETEGLSTAFPYSGFAVMRSGLSKKDVFALLECAPFGFGHQHEDKLEILLDAYGKTMLYDPGNYAYDTSDMRKYIISAYSHNTVLIDGRGQCRRASYSWHPEDIGLKADVAFRDDASETVASGCYTEGFRFDKGIGNNIFGADVDAGDHDLSESIFVDHTRTVVYKKQGIDAWKRPFFIVIDRMLPRDNKAHLAEALFHAPDDLLTEVTGNGVRFDYGDSVSLTLLGESVPEIRRGATVPYMCGWKPVHGADAHEHKKTPTAVFSYPVMADGTSFVTLLLPSDGEMPVTGFTRDERTLTLYLTDGKCAQLDLSTYFDLKKENPDG